MRTDEWTFYNLWHPVYERPEENRAWIGAPEAFRPRDYKTAHTLARENEQDTAERTAEPLLMDAVGHPSVDLYRTPNGETIEKITLYTDYMDGIDLAEVQEVAQSMLAAMQALSQGPYSLADLHDMGHPYGYGDRKEPMSWERIRRPRAIPHMGRAAYAPGLRGRVSDYSVINLQSGNLLKSWRLTVLKWFGGVNILLRNSAYYAWFLGHGSVKMQAHGPWDVIVSRMLPALMTAWRRAAYRSWRAQMRRQAAEAAAMEGQFGMGATMTADREFDAGGFA